MYVQFHFEVSCFDVRFIIITILSCYLYHIMMIMIIILVVILSQMSGARSRLKRLVEGHLENLNVV